MNRPTEMIDDGQILRGDPECQYKFLEAKLAPSIDPSATVDVACFMTTDGVDADNEVVLPLGADLSRFEKNPVLMLCHGYGQPGCYYPLPVGRVVWTKKRPHGVMAGIQFARSTAMGQEVKGLFDEDMVRSFSIGFRSIESSPMTREEARARPDWIAAYERTGGRIVVHRKWSLLELSVAPIPSNEDALRAKYAARGLPVPDWIPLKTPREAPMTQAALPTIGGALWKAVATPIAEGDAVQWTRKGGGCGLVQSIHTKGQHAEEPEKEDSEVLDASEHEPVAKVRCYRKEDDSYVETDSIKAFHCKHLTRMAGGLPAPAPESAKCAGRCGEPNTNASAIQAHDFVRINAPHHKGYGLVKSIHDREMVPDVEEDVLGTSDNPAARVKCYKAMGDGFVPTNRHVGHHCKHLEKVPPLRPPSQSRDQGMGSTFAGSNTPQRYAGPGEHQTLEDVVAKLTQVLDPQSIQQMVAEELDRRMGYV